MKISIEDFCEDIVGKAVRGRGLSVAEVSERSGVSAESLEDLLNGRGEEATARAIAPVLGLDAEKLVDSLLGQWYPDVPAVEGLFGSNTPYHDMFVNAYLIWKPGAKVGALFDTGADASALLDQARVLDVELSDLFLTHTHRDHVMDLKRVRKVFPGIAIHVGEREQENVPEASAVKPGDAFRVGEDLRVTARLTFGHSAGGITYLVEGLVLPLAVVGDAVFAGSMGGGMVSYADALRTNREGILSLPDETVLCPGHGPLTTVAQEKAHNPFF